MYTRDVTFGWRTAGAVLVLVMCLPIASAWAAAKAAPPVDGGWPRAYETASGAQVVVYQPQVATWDDQKRMTAYAAVSYFSKGAKEPTPGTVKIEADTKVALDDRLVSFTSMNLTEANFPDLQKEQTQEIVSEITEAIPEEERVIALDRVLAAVDKSQVMPKNAQGIKADPPNVYFSTSPALLVVFDGEPVWSPIKENNLKFAVNTNWDVFQDNTGAYYLRNDKTWLKTQNLKDKWIPAGKLPDSFDRLPAADWPDVRQSLPGQKVSAGSVPAVFVSEMPAEMILLKGEPQYKPVEGTSLLWVSNTESDVFRLGPAGSFYYLVAGRWFSAPDLKGPWTFATPTLPADFKSIPPEHPRSRVLASVPGTDQAAEGVMLAQVPQTARVNIKEVKAPEVVYQDAPQFEPIENTTVERAVNTDKDIIKVGDVYYMCFQGVWFMSTSPNGPWSVTTKVAEEIYTIPASSPAYNVTYVTIDDDDYDDDWAEFVCAAGYTGMMVAWGCAVWGSGYYYPPYVWHGGFYPCYYPRPVTFGCAAAYNPWTGRYGWAAGGYGPYGGFGAGAVYNPRTGTYARGAVAYGPNGAVGAARAYNPRTGAYGATRQGANVYGSWGSTYVQRGDNWASSKRYTNRATGDTTRMTRTDNGSALTHRGGPGDNGFVAKGDGGNVYAGRDGNVYKRENGSWEQVNRGGGATPRANTTGADRAQAGNRATASPTSRVGATAPRTAPRTTTTNRGGQAGVSTQPVNRSVSDQLNRDYQARTQGTQRTNTYSNMNAGNRSYNTGSYRPSTTGSTNRNIYNSGGGGRSGYNAPSRGGYSGGSRGGFSGGGGRGGFSGGGGRGGGRR